MHSFLDRFFAAQKNIALCPNVVSITIVNLTIFLEGSFLPILCARSIAISGISHPDSAIIDLIKFLISSADSFFCDGMSVILTYNILPYCSFSSHLGRLFHSTASGFSHPTEELVQWMSTCSSL